MTQLEEARRIAGSYVSTMYQILGGMNREYSCVGEFVASSDAENCLIVDNQGKPVGIYVLLAGGGPTVWLNTYDGIVYASTGGETAGCSISQEICLEIEEFYNIY